MTIKKKMDAVEYVPILKTEHILKTSFDLDFCDKIIELGKTKINTEVVDNLEGVYRTGWDLQSDPDFTPHLAYMTEVLSGCISKKFNYPHFRGANESYQSKGFQMALSWLDMWVGYYDKYSFVHPHNHGELPSFWSFSAYLSTGESSESSLYFMSDESPERSVSCMRVNVKRGDVLIFPSNIFHYTNDCAGGRVVMASNFFCGYIPNMNSGEE